GEVKPIGHKSEPGGKAPEERAFKHVLLVSENFEQVDFTRQLAARTTTADESIPQVIRPAMKPHQVTGFSWLQECWKTGCPGVLLADDMGLGKTLQVLAFLAWMQDALRHVAGKRRPGGPCLVVAPTGLLENWIAEHSKHLYEPGLGELRRGYG